MDSKRKKKQTHTQHNTTTHINIYAGDYIVGCFFLLFVCWFFIFHYCYCFSVFAIIVPLITHCFDVPWPCECMWVLTKLQTYKPNTHTHKFTHMNIYSSFFSMHFCQCALRSILLLYYIFNIHSFSNLGNQFFVLTGGLFAHVLCTFNIHQYKQQKHIYIYIVFWMHVNNV